MGLTRASAWAVLLLCLSVVLVFGRSCRHDFLYWDDQVTLTGNPMFNPPSVPGLAGAWTGPRQELYIPVTYTFWGMLSASAWDPEVGLHPAAFRAASVVLHLISALVVWLLLRIWTSSDRGAAFGALLFALHPIQVEPVAWISGQKDLLCGLFALGALLCHTLSVKHERYAARWLVGAATLYALALLSKPAAVTLPLVAIAVDLLLLRRDMRRSLVIFAVGIAMAMPIAIVAAIVQPAPLVDPAPLWARPLIAGDAIAFYVGKILFPFGLTVDYGRSPQQVLALPIVWVMWLVPAVLLVAAWLVRRRAPVVATAAVVLVAPLLPVLGLVPFSFQNYSTVADHYLYLSMLAPSMVLAMLVARFRTAIWPAALVIAGLALASVVQVGRWRDTDALFTYALSVNPHSSAAHKVLGFRASEAGDNERAAAHYERSLATNPNDPITQHNLGNAYARMDRYADAAERYREALAMQPDHVAAHAYLGIVLGRLGQRDEALVHLSRAVELGAPVESLGPEIERIRAGSSTSPATAPATAP